MKSTEKKEEVKQFRKPETCRHCDRKAALFVEGETVLEDSFRWQSRHDGDIHVNTKPILEIVEEWIASGRVNVDEVVEYLKGKKESAEETRLSALSFATL